MREPEETPSIFNLVTLLFEVRIVQDGFYVNLIQARVIWEEGTLTEEYPQPDWPVGKLVWLIFFTVIDVGGAIPERTVPCQEAWWVE